MPVFLLTAEAVAVSARRPRLRRTYGGGYWLRTYGLNAWNLGSVSGTTYWLLVPSTMFGVIVAGQLHTVYAAGGYNASGLNCTIPGATGNVAAAVARSWRYGFVATGPAGTGNLAPCAGTRSTPGRSAAGWCGMT